VQVRDVMTRDVLTVGPATAVTYAGEAMAAHGYAALPVLDDEDRLIGIVAEADVLRRRVPDDPRLHLRRDAPADAVPPDLVAGVMTPHVRTVEAGSDVADVARLFVAEGLRSVPVRPDAALRDELRGLIEAYTGEPGAYAVDVREGVATVRRTSGTSQPSADVEARALTEIARTVPGIVACEMAGNPAKARVGTAGERA
jgi:CBS domain-containing protein